MDTSLFQSAMLMGLSIAAPVGPIALLCMHTCLRHGWRHGFLAGLGVASADACYGLIGAAGISGLLQLFMQLKMPLGLMGAAFLLYMSWQIWHQVEPIAKPDQTAAGATPAPRYRRSFFMVFMLTLSNPMTILSFIAIFASMNLGSTAERGWLLTITVVAGVFSGSALWWLFLCSVIASLKRRFDFRYLQILNRLSAIAIAAFAAWQVWHAYSAYSQ